MAYLKNAWLSKQAKASKSFKFEVLDRLSSLISELDANPVLAHITTGLGPVTFGAPDNTGDVTLTNATTPGIGRLSESPGMGSALGGGARSVLQYKAMGARGANMHPPLIAKAYLYLVRAPLLLFCVFWFCVYAFLGRCCCILSWMRAMRTCTRR